MADQTGAPDPLPEVPGVDVRGVIGRGASSVVYLGTQRSMGRQVAVKVLDLPGQGELAAKLFLTESSTLGRMARHPNIVVVHDAGLAPDGRPYLVMEYLPGGTLAQRLHADGPLEVGEVLRIGVRLAGALETTHRHGVVHGDVKPQNVLRSQGGDVALSDFGIARLLGSASSTTRVPVFTPLHAAPELFEGAGPTVRTDVYELCSTLFELLDGQPALGTGTDSPLLIVGRMSRGERRSLGDGIPPELVEVIDAGLATDPAQRPSSAAELGERLRAVERSLGREPTEMVVLDGLEDPDDGPGVDAVAAGPADRPTLTPEPATGPGRRPLVALVVALALVAGVVAALVVSGDDERAQPVAPTTTSSVVPINTLTGPAPDPSTTTTLAPGVDPNAPQPTVTTMLMAGIQPNARFDVEGVGSSTPILNASVGRADWAVVDPAVEIVDLPAFGVERTPARLQYQFLNTRSTPECPGFLTPQVILQGVVVKGFKYGPGGADYGVLQVYEFEDPAAARMSAAGFSLEQGPTAEECFGFAPAPRGGVTDPEAFGVRHQVPPLALPAEVEYTSWDVPSTDSRFAHAFKVVSQRGDSLVLVIFNTTLASGPQDPATVSTFLTSLWAQLPG